MPQQRWTGTLTSTPLRSSTRTAARPTAGALYSTVHVENSATFRLAVLPPSAAAGLAVDLNHDEKVGRWNFGSRRSLWMPVTACMNARCTASSFIQFDSGAVRLPTLPTRSALPSMRSCTVTPCCRASAARARSINRGKSIAHRWGGV
jgi:hypothetical protein